MYIFANRLCKESRGKPRPSGTCKYADVAAARKLKANWFTTQNGKHWETIVNNELPLFKRTNQERPYEQLLHYRNMHISTNCALRS